MGISNRGRGLTRQNNVGAPMIEGGAAKPALHFVAHAINYGVLAGAVRTEHSDQKAGRAQPAVRESVGLFPYVAAKPRWMPDDGGDPELVPRLFNRAGKRTCQAGGNEELIPSPQKYFARNFLGLWASNAFHQFF